MLGGLEKNERTIKRLFAIAVLVVGCGTVNDGPVGKSVADVHQARFRLMTRNDLDSLASLLADDLVYVHTTGERETKQQFLARLRSGSLRYRSIEPLETAIENVDDTATITGRA